MGKKHARTHTKTETHTHTTGKLQQWLLMFHNIVYLCRVSEFFLSFKGTLPEGKCGRGLLEGWVFRHRQYFPHLSCFNASLLARLNHMCSVLSWINNGHFGGLAGTWWPHADGSLMSSTGTAPPWHWRVSQRTRPCPRPSPQSHSVWALIT